MTDVRYNIANLIRARASNHQKKTFKCVFIVLSLFLGGVGGLQHLLKKMDYHHGWRDAMASKHHVRSYHPFVIWAFFLLHASSKCHCTTFRALIFPHKAEYCRSDFIPSLHIIGIYTQQTPRGKKKIHDLTGYIKWDNNNEWRLRKIKAKRWFTYATSIRKISQRQQTSCPLTLFVGVNS